MPVDFLTYNGTDSSCFKPQPKNQEDPMDLGIKGRSAIVTGGSRGIGR